jgi:hypothetical protein
MGCVFQRAYALCLRQNATHTHGGLLRVGCSALSVLVNDAINDVLVTR